MHKEGDHICFCPLEGVIDVISKKWALLIVNALGNSGRLRFNGLMEQLGGISPKTLSDTLHACIRKTKAEEIRKRQNHSSLTNSQFHFQKRYIRPG